MTRPAAKLVHLRGAAGMDAIYRRITWRLLPLLMLCGAVACLDRIHIGYAQARMALDLPFGELAYAWGAALLLLGHLLCGVPAALLLERYGARQTLLRMMFGWGVVAVAGAFVKTPFEFYLSRFALGVFEAGFFPGVILYFTYWYPAARRAVPVALFTAAALAAGIVAGPLCDATLRHLDQAGGMTGWQWLLLLQGAPAAVLGVALYCWLADGPDHADWLPLGEQHMLLQDVAQDDAAHGEARDGDDDEGAIASNRMLALLADPAIHLLCAGALLIACAGGSLLLHLPSLLAAWGAPANSRWLAALPQCAAIAAMLWTARRYRRLPERRRHCIGALLTAVAGLLVTGAASAQLELALAGLVLAAAGIGAAAPLFITIVCDSLTPAGRAAGIALVAGAAMLGGALSPWAVALTEGNGRSDGSALLYLLIVLYLAAGTLLLALRTHGDAAAAQAAQLDDNPYVSG